MKPMKPKPRGPDTPPDDQGATFVATPEQVAKVDDFVNDCHRRIAAAVNPPPESPEAHFKAIEYSDAVPGIVLTKYELLAALKYIENDIRSDRFEQWLYQQFSSGPMRREVAVAGFIEKVAALIGIEAVWQAIDEAFNEFNIVQQRSKVAPLWRCYLARNNPAKFTASAEDQAELARYWQSLDAAHREAAGA
jgi:hypothetical protein